MTDLIKEEIYVNADMFAYVSRPKNAEKTPALIVIQEIFGVNDAMRVLCDRYAEAGYTAICPDLFHRIEKRVNITDKTEAEMQKAFDLFGKFDIDAGIRDVAETITYARALPYTTEKAGAVGYCLGGFLAYLTATRTDANASVSYYGVKIDTALDEAKNINAPLLLHIAGDDQFVSPEAQEKIVAGLENVSFVETHRYPGAEHAFARPEGVHFNATHAEKANGLTASFLRKHLFQDHLSVRKQA